MKMQSWGSQPGLEAVAASCEGLEEAIELYEHEGKDLEEEEESEDE